jgi:hypothetical protein
MSKRQPDGKWRGNKQTTVVSESGLRSRWIELETIQLKRIGLSFDAIADQITRSGRRTAQAVTSIPEGVTFPPDFQISRQACHKAFRKAIAREPSIATEEFRKLDSARLEDMFLNLQPGIRKGNPRSVEAGVKVLRHAAQLNGYSAPQRHELTGKDGSPLTLVQLLEAVGEIDDDERK